jgi:ribosomal 30S subunit maturation factor RimM
MGALRLPTSVLVSHGRRREERTLISCRQAAERWLLAFEGAASREAAAALTHGVLALPRHLLPALPARRFYLEDLVGAVVLDLE